MSPIRETSFYVFTGATLLLSLFLLVIKLRRDEQRPESLPPGPKGLPFVGNIYQLPLVDQHKCFTQWGAQYGQYTQPYSDSVTNFPLLGDVVYARFFQQPVIILNSAQSAIDLMEKRGAKYSGRPRFVYLSELWVWPNAQLIWLCTECCIGSSARAQWSGGGAWVTYNNIWKQHRKWFQHALITRSNLDRYLPLQRREVNTLLSDLLANPCEYKQHLKRSVRLERRLVASHK